MSKKLYRSRDDRMLAGVCGGVADYFDVDSSLVRLAVLFIFLFQGVGLIAYIIGWVLISEEPVKNEYKMPDDYYIEDGKRKDKEDQYGKNRAGSEQERNENYDQNYDQNAKKESEKEYYQQYQDQNSKSNNNRRKLFAVIMILVGSIFLVDIWIPDLYWEKYWPLILIAVGVLMFKGDNDDR